MVAPMPNWLRSAKTLLLSRKGITIFKGSLAYTIAFILVFCYDFIRLSKHPQTLPTIFLAVILGSSGKAVGATLSNNLLIIVGLLVGSFNFYVLAKLSRWVVAQGVYFFLVVYAVTFVKTRGPRYSAASILSVLLAFNGVYSSLLLGRKFDHEYLLGYLKANLWGCLICVGVSLFVLPISSEKELRKTLIISLQHIETFGMLVARSYLRIITEEERELRDDLAQTIRADFGRLTQKLEETTLEINWSKWSLDDYRYFIGKTRALQLALISTHSSLSMIETTEEELYKTAFIPKTLGSFNRVRLDMRLTIREIERAFGFHGADMPRCAWDSYMDVERQLQVERPASDRRRTNSFLDMAADADRQAQLRAVSQRLAAEFENVPHEDEDEEAVDMESRSSVDSIPLPRSSATSRPASTIVPTSQPMSIVGQQSDSISRGASSVATPSQPTSANTPRASRTPRTPRSIYGEEKSETPMTEGEMKAVQKVLKERGPQSLLSDFKIFNDVQHELINKALTGGTLTDCSAKIRLKVNLPQPSVLEMYGHDYVRGKLADLPASATASSVMVSPLLRKRRVRYEDEAGDERRGPCNDDTVVPARTEGGSDAESEVVEDESKWPLGLRMGLAGDHSLIKVYSMLFAFSQYVTELSEFHARVTAIDARGRPRKSRLHFHFFERLTAPETPATTGTRGSETLGTDLSLHEAIAILESKPYQPQKTDPSQRIHALKTWVLSKNSLYAAKTAAAATVFALFIYIDTTRKWFLDYNVTTGMITVIVALAPTLGQSAFTFVLQISGSALGYLVGLAFLSIFHNVGSYVYNPFGIAVLVFFYSIPLMYVIYEHPKFFPFGFLAMNGTGVLVTTEWIYHQFWKIPFDSPAYRTGKALASLSVAVSIVSVFQLIVWRNPARRSLRLALAHLTGSNLAYLTLLQAFVRAMIPADPSHSVPAAAIHRVHSELKRREIKIQSEIISIMPLITFAAAEPSLSNKFSAKPHLRIIRACQIILDRLREARSAVGTTRFDDQFLREFVAPLSPYRRRSARLNKTYLALSSASLFAKLPLPSDVSRAELSSLVPDFFHDALVLSHRFAQTPEGQKAVQSGEFTRYWFYFLGVTSISQPLYEIRDVCHELFGGLEDTMI